MTNRSRMSAALFAVFALALTLGLSGCKTTPGGGGAAGPTKGGTLRYYVGTPAYIDPYNTQESEGTQIEQAVFDSLVEFSPLDPSKLVPAAAESWSANSDATVWTFKLRKDATFQDGAPVTAQDFVYEWNRIANPKTLNTATGKADPSVISYHLAPIKGYDEVQAGKATEMSGVKAIDDNTLEVTLKQPFGDFEYVVGHPSLAPVQKKYVEGGVDFNGKKVPFGDMPIGNGPFKLSEPWKHGQFVKVARYDGYWGPKPLVDGVDFMEFKDPNTAYTEFQAGNLDFSLIGEGKIADAKSKYGVSDNGYTANPGKQVLLGAENSTYYLVINNKMKPFDNVNFRKAISLAINRQAISDAVFQGTREPADNIVPPGIAGYEKGLWPDARYDVEAAKKALADAGFPGGKGAPTVDLQYNADGGHQKIMELVQADLKAIGVNAKLAGTPDFPTYLKMWDAGKGQIGRLGWSADYPIMDNFLFPIFTSKSTDNYSKYNNPAVDTGIADARKITNTADRLKAYNAIDKLIGADSPIAPVMFYKHHHVASDRVHDLTYGAQDLADFTKVWISGGTSK